MKRTVKIGAWLGLGVLALLAAVAVLVANLDWSRFRAPLERRASDALGRPVHLAGLGVHVGRVLTVSLSGVRVANAPWGSDPDMAEIEQATIQVALLPLLRGRVVVPSLTVEGPRLLLEKSADGSSNWDLGKGNDKQGSRRSVPVLQSMDIRHGRLVYRDPKKGIDIASDVQTAIGGDTAHGTVRLEGHGGFAGKPFQLAITAGSLLELREGDRPYPLAIHAAVGGTRMDVDGTLAEPVKMQGVKLDVALAGPDLAEIFPILGIPAPHTAPYRLEGRLTGQGQSWAFEDFTGKVGKSDLSGALAFDAGAKPPFLKGRLVSERLAAADLAGFVGARPGQPRPKDAPLIPDSPIDLERLRAVNMELSFLGKRVELPHAPVSNLDVSLGLDDGLLVLEPFSVELAQGDVSGRVVLDGRRQVPRVEARLRFSKVDFGRFFAGTRFEGQMAGMLQGRLELAGSGATTGAWLRNADGRLALVMDGGSFSDLAVQAMGLDVAKALGLLVTSDRPVGLRCFVADLPVNNGVAATRALVLDTEDNRLDGQGQVDLGRETFDLTLTAHPKSPSLFSARTPVRAHGPWRKPEVGIEAGPEVARGAAAVLGAVVNPLLAIVPFLDPGLGEDSKCNALIQQAQSPD